MMRGCCVCSRVSIIICSEHVYWSTYIEQRQQFLGSICSFEYPFYSRTLFDCFTMSSDQNSKHILSEHRVIPDVLAEEPELSYGLTLTWPDATLDTPGKEIGREETQPEPKVYLNPVVCRRSTYILSHPSTSALTNGFS